MSRTKLIEVKSYFDPDVFAEMERIRLEDPEFRRDTRSRFVEDRVVEFLRNRKRPAKDVPVGVAP
jgi:hypothetical protein